MSSFSAPPRRPRLVAQNRKLRHLQGLSLRNLCFESLQAADDASLSSLSPLSPNSKLEALPETRSQSSASSPDRHGTTRIDKGRTPTRRRSSLSWSYENPASRQRKLEELIDSSVADVFFSLHVAGDPEPVYVSEVRERSANFDFRFFTLAELDPWASRACVVTIRVWFRRASRDRNRNRHEQEAVWAFLLEQVVDLRELNFIGTLVDRRFPPNALVFHLDDGLYSLDFATRAAEPRQAPASVTSSYNALMKLAHLEAAIRDAVETRQRITEQINAILAESPVDATEAAAEEAALADKYVASQRRTNRLVEKRRDDLRESLRSRRAAIVQGREAQARAEEDIANNTEVLESSRQLAAQTARQIRGQRRRICAELSEIFPLTAIDDAPPLSFRICNLPLPNSTYDAAIARTLGEDALSAALGLAALLVRNLQFYLSHPLLYPLQAHGSRSCVRDDISHVPGNKQARREFPLHLPRGGSTTGQWRFEYAWFLLNKNVETLCASQGLKVVDIRHTLPNLKYLLYVCSAGTDEVPERTKGGVRGLWLGRLNGRLPEVTVSAAVPSTVPSATPAVLSAVPFATLVPADAESSSSAAGSRRASLDDADAPTKTNGRLARWGGRADGGTLLDESFTLRTKGLRENIAGI
ncbi:hypothetical protein RJ55_01504 [Drechmeria coniospora]|nr:hypothetical protein RJ55_01504 [Drechmeria coniospora]